MSFRVVQVLFRFVSMLFRFGYLMFRCVKIRFLLLNYNSDLFHFDF